VRSAKELARLAALALLFAATPAFAADAAMPEKAEIDRAVEAVKKDPNLAAEKSVRTLKWKGSKDKEEKKKRSSNWPSWLSWIPNLFLWIGQFSQMLVWVLIAGLVALLLMFIVRVVREVRVDAKGTRFIAPTHVQDLDIRPESLPPDIGAAARELWDRGEHRAALALLYRGMLSRLAHVHEVPIRDSSTEGDCLGLAARTLDAVRIAYITRLVRTWQRATYGGISIETPVVHELCDGFAANLDAPQQAESPRGAALSGAGA
jgi:hypothetical protein